MDPRVEKYARMILLQDLLECTNDQQMIFKKMYSPDNLKATIVDVVDNLPEEKIDWAMKQVLRTIEKKKKKEQ